ncbi:MAG: hypothetical protein WA830_25005, partial [Candidatus Sulfotelmatobacter sp.]
HPRTALLAKPKPDAEFRPLHRSESMCNPKSNLFLFCENPALPAPGKELQATGYVGQPPSAVRRA